MSEENNSEFQNTENQVEETKSKSGIFTLIIGIILIVRGVMRFNQEGLEIFGGIMLLIGLASLVVFFKDRI